MAITHSPDSDSVEPSGSVFTGGRIITSFPRHDVVKLDEVTFIQWQQQVRFILASYVGCSSESQLHHELHSLKKASGSQISEDERTAVLLVGLSSEFDAIVPSASLSSYLSSNA
ncbi:hypothetical protein PVK06_044439 [Gossypium arboreum]|uniref:Uncharacterized protein n=1 Tax=Gossypium arboreum TaxID=29729 RepID=A0ABR0MSX6_GOSAR|nr:hypothetical protein PVK06_044439 [Gossypium arboreum]